MPSQPGRTEPRSERMRLPRLLETASSFLLFPLESKPAIHKVWRRSSPRRVEWRRLSGGNVNSPRSESTSESARDTDPDGLTLLYDGLCGICNASVRYIL